MASHISSNLYSIVSMDPITNDAGLVIVYTCLPVDSTPDGGISEDTRYVTLVSVPIGVKSDEILTLFDYARAFACSWVTYMWEVS